MDFYLFGECGYSAAKLEIDFNLQQVKIVLEQDGQRMVGGQTLQEFENNLKQLQSRFDMWRKKNGKK